MIHRLKVLGTANSLDLQAFNTVELIFSPVDIDAISIIFLPSPLSLDLSIEFENGSIATRMRSLLLNKKQKR